MSDAELESGVDIDNETATRLVDSLPTHFPKAKGSPNYKIFGGPAEEADDLREDIDEVQSQTLVTEADSIESLEELSKFVGVRSRSSDTLESFRKRTIATFHNVTSEATIKDILDSASFVLEISPERITYIENPEPGVVFLELPAKAISDSELQTEEIVEILSQNIAAGYELQAVSKGSLIHVTPTRLENEEYEQDQTYAGLDEDGNITDGGTYSTIIS